MHFKYGKPSIFITVSWPLLRYKISTRQNLFSMKNIVDFGGISCVFCNKSVKSVCHFFVRHYFLDQVWYRVFRWLG